MTVDYPRELTEQLDWHWMNQLRPRLSGLTDEEYFWEPVDGCWSIRPKEGGGFSCDWAPTEPSPPPITTIAWRLAHISTMVFGLRTATHFEGVTQADYGAQLATRDWPGTAAEGLATLDDAYERWLKGVRSWSADDLAAECGMVEGPWARYPRATLVLHISREAIHHGAEVALLRDLYRASGGGRFG